MYKVDFISENMVFEVSPVDVHSEVLIIPSSKRLRYLLLQVLFRLCVRFVYIILHLRLIQPSHFISLQHLLVPLFLQVIWVDRRLRICKLHFINIEHVWLSLCFLLHENLKDRDVERNIIFEALHFKTHLDSIVFLKVVLLEPICGHDLFRDGVFFGWPLFCAVPFFLGFLVKEIVDDMHFSALHQWEQTLINAFCLAKQICKIHPIPLRHFLILFEPRMHIEVWGYTLEGHEACLDAIRNAKLHIYGI